MKYNLLLLSLLASAFLANCTGQKASINKHDGAKEAAKISQEADAQVFISKEINAIDNEDEKLKKAESFLANDFPKSDLKTRYSAETQRLITFAIKKWSQKGQIDQFNKLVNFLFSETDVDARVVEAFENIETKSLIFKSANETKDPVFKFKLILLFKKIQQAVISIDDLAFMQNQLNAIKKETGFKFTETSQAWIKTNRDLVEKLVAMGAETKAQFDEKEFEGVSISRAQRETMLISFLKTKKNIEPILSPTAVKEIKEYRINLAKIKAEIPVFSSKIKLNEIKDDTIVGIIVSLLIADMDSTQLEALIRMKLIDKEFITIKLNDWMNYEVAQIVRKYKEEFGQFQLKKVNYTSYDYFPEMRKSLATSQMLSRERVERMRMFMPVAKILDSNVTYQRIVDMDIFFKRLLTSNTTLLILKLFSENSIQLRTEVLLNNQVIKKETSNNLKTSIVIPNVMLISEGFYLGELADQFDFSLNDRMLQKFEIMDGIDQGIQLGLFRELGFDEQDILKSLFIWMTQSRLVQVNVLKAGQLQETKVFKLHENLKLRMASVEWQTYKSFCSSLKNNQTIPRDFTLEDIKVSPLMGRLANNVEANPSTTEIGGSANLLGLFPYNGEVTKSLEFLRTDVSYVLLFMQTMTDSLTAAGVDKSKIETEINHFKSFYTEYLKDYLSYVSDFDECYFKKQIKEQELYFKIFEYEKKYWQFVLEKVSGQKNILISSVAPLSYELPNGIKQRSYYANNSLQLMPFDFYFRIKQYLQFGLSLGDLKLPPIDTNIAIQFSASLASQRIYKQDADFKGVSFKDETVESKVQKIVTSHDFSGNTFVGWFAKSNLTISKFIEQVDTLQILHRFGPGLKESFNIEAKITLEQLTRSYFNVMHVFSLSNEMKQILSLVGIKEIADMDSMIAFGLLLVEKEVALPFYDGTLKSMSQSFMGYFGNDANFMGSGESRTIRRPMQLLSTDFIMKLLYRYYDESYVSPFRSGKIDFARYISRMTEEKEISRRIVDYVNHVEKTKADQFFTLDIRTILSLKVPLYSVSAKDNLSAVVLDMNKKLSVIQKVAR